MTMAPTTSSLALKRPPAPYEWQHLLPSQPTALQQTPQSLISHPEPPCATTILLPTTAATPVATTSETMANLSSTQIATTTLEICHQAINDAQRPCTAQQTNLCNNEETHLSECVVYLIEQPHQPQQSTGKLSTAPNPHQLNSQTPIKHPEMPCTTTTSLSTCLSMAPESRPLPHSGPPTAAQKRQNKHLNPPEHPQSTCQPPCWPDPL